MKTIRMIVACLFVPAGIVSFVYFSTYRTVSDITAWTILGLLIISGVSVVTLPVSDGK